MSTDLTLLYYSANTLPKNVEQNFQNALLKVVGNEFPIISVTQKHTEFGRNLFVGEIGQSYYNIYKQMYFGVQEVKTKYVAVIEDDSLYTAEHFTHRPSDDTVFSYNTNWWFLDPEVFWNRGHIGMFSCIATTKQMHKALKQRFDRFPMEPTPREYQKYFWMEFGKDEKLGFNNERVEFFATKEPLVTLCYYGATYGRPKRHKNTSTSVEELAPWGRATDLRKRIGL